MFAQAFGLPSTSAVHNECRTSPPIASRFRLIDDASTLELGVATRGDSS